MKNPAKYFGGLLIGMSLVAIVAVDPKEWTAVALRFVFAGLVPVGLVLYGHGLKRDVIKELRSRSGHASGGGH